MHDCWEFSEIISVGCLAHSRSSADGSCGYRQWTLHGLFYWIPTTTLWGRHWDDSHFTNEELEVQSGFLTPRPTVSNQAQWPRILVINKLYNISSKSIRSLAGQREGQNFCIFLHNTLVASWGYWFSTLKWLCVHKGLWAAYKVGRGNIRPACLRPIF